MNNYKLISTVFLAFWISIGYSQSSSLIEKPVVGKPCPDYEFNDVTYHKSKKLNISDFKGKWIILDFWSPSCKGCIENMPKMNEMQKRFKDQLKIVLVGTISKYYSRDKVYACYDRIRKENDLNLTSVYDNILMVKLKLNGLPYAILVDPNGIVRALTVSVGIRDFEDLLSGRVPKFERSFAGDEVDTLVRNYNTNLPVLVAGNGGKETDYLYRSILLEAGSGIIPVNIEKNGRFEVMDYRLTNLYQLAYFGVSNGHNFLSGEWKKQYGKVCYDLILEVADSTLFDLKLARTKRFGYSLCYPSIDISKNKYAYMIDNNPWLRQKMQHDLADYFPYDANIEYRNCSYYKLVATNDARKKLKTKGEDDKNLAAFPEVILNNQPVSQIIDYLHNFSFSHPILDETGIEFNIDLDLRAYTKQGAIKLLRRQGLDLILAEKKMKCLVIRDQKTTETK